MSTCTKTHTLPPAMIAIFLLCYSSWLIYCQKQKRAEVLLFSLNRCHQDNGCLFWHRPEGSSCQLSSYLHAIGSVDVPCCMAVRFFLAKFLFPAIMCLLRISKKNYSDKHRCLCNLNDCDIIALYSFFFLAKIERLHYAVNNAGNMRG